MISFFHFVVFAVNEKYTKLRPESWLTKKGFVLWKRLQHIFFKFSEMRGKEWNSEKIFNIRPLLPFSFLHCHIFSILGECTQSLNDFAHFIRPVNKRKKENKRIQHRFMEKCTQFNIHIDKNSKRKKIMGKKIFFPFDFCNLVWTSSWLWRPFFKIYLRSLGLYIEIHERKDNWVEIHVKSMEL